MQYNEIKNIIINSLKKDWEGISNDPKSIYFYKLDVNLRMECEYDFDLDNRDYYVDEWANKFSHSESKATRNIWHVYYISTLVYSCYLVNASWPGGSVAVPQPDHDMKVTKLDYKIALIQDTQNNLDRNLEQFGINVKE